MNTANEAPMEQLTEDEALAILESELPTIDSEYVGFADNMHRFQVTVSNGEYSNAFDYSMGRAHQDKDGNPVYPDKLDVWYSLVLDTVTVLNSGPTMDDLIDSLVSEFGYDDSVGAYKAAKALTENYLKIKNIGITANTINRWNDLFCQAQY